MGKLSVFVYLLLGVFILFLVGRNPKSPSRQRHRRLQIRTSFNFSQGFQRDHTTFDPLVAGIERHREDKQWEKVHLETKDAPGEQAQPEWEDFMNAEDFINDEEKFNVTDRLILLFPKIDVGPTDGFVTERELTEWNLKQALTEVMHRTQREMELHDKNHDGYVSFSEYEPPSWVHNTDRNSFGYDMGWWKEGHFNASDADGDRLLNITEFNDFLHPSDSTRPELLRWLCREEVRERDTDKDGKLNFPEFFGGLFDLVRNYGDGSSGDDAKALFSQLDKDSDGYLSDEELFPIIGKLHPSEGYYAKQQSDYITSQADTDKDGRLTLKEMLENPYVFYSAIFSDDEDDLDYHEELR